MGIFRFMFGGKKKIEVRNRSNTGVSQTSEASDVLEQAGVSIYTENEKGQKIKIAGGNPPSETAIQIYNKGVEFLEQGKIEEAVKMFKKALDDSPNYTAARYNFARSLFKLNRYNEAQKQYDLLLEIQPNDVDALNNLGTIHAMSNNLEKAMSLFERALSVNPDFALTHRNLAAYYQAVGNESKKEQHVKRALELDKNIFSD